MFFTILTQWSSAQNLVPNPSFENTNGDLCGIYNVNDYSSTVDDWYAPTQGTPDLFFTNIASSCWNFQPASTYSGPIGLKGPQIPRTGEVMSGLFLYTIQGLTQREYIQVPLSSPLIVGKKYIVECYVSLADNTEFASDRMGMYLSVQPVSLQSNNVLNYTPQVIADGVISDKENWVRVSDTILVTDAYEYLTIGNFSSDAQTPLTENSTYSGQPGAYGSYYFIDDVRVELFRDNSTTGVNLFETEESEKTVVKIIDFMGRETKFKPNTPLIYIYSDGTSKRIIHSEQ